MSYGDLMQLADPVVRAETASLLFEGGLRYAWDAMRPAEEGLFALDAEGAIEVLAAEPKLSANPRQTTAGVFAARATRIAENDGLRATPVPAYGNRQAGVDFGFEVKIDGPPTGKRVLVRIALQSAASVRRGGHAIAERVINSRGG